MNLILLGPPGAGKGTQAVRIEETYQIPHISTGDIFRKAIKDKTELGKKAKEYIDQGQLVPDTVTNGIVRERLSDEDCKEGFILDGFPRTVNQADALSSILEELNLSLNAVINIRVSDEEVINRLSGRRICKSCGASFHIKFNPPAKSGECDECGGDLYQREDDNPETIKERLNVYSKKTSPLIDYYEERKLLKTINGEQGLDEVFEEIDRFLDTIK
ncbi:adenylate kinase [Orenia marismortui]|uniref:Adenylate kinase n=1 Tax=Orenia marismortui TaxID=46469 RepID=A0A4R8H2C2_9FIRM|nr:adenylate kinase [Orenia marismortui]TDX49268.1 adenylate kinase [Orenia marismortui]